MKNYRMLAPILMALLMFVSCYTMVTDAQKDHEEITQLVRKGQAWEEQQLYTKAAESYFEAAQRTGDKQYYYRIIDMYFNANDYSTSLVWCENALDQNQNDAMLYYRRLRAEIAGAEYKQAYITLDEFDSRKLISPEVDELRKSIKWMHSTSRSMYRSVSASSGGYMRVEAKAGYGLMDAAGRSVLQPVYKEMGYFANDLLPVCTQKDEWYLVDLEGVYQHNISLNIPGKITEVGIYNEGLLPICVDGRYAYYDITFKKIFGDYDYAGPFSQGVAAVKNGEEWQLINTTGAAVSKEPIAKIVLDERGVCARNDRVFALIGDTYRMLDLNGAIVGDTEYSDVRAFAETSSLAAVKIGADWKFIDKNGEVKLEYTCSDAGSFAFGLAPVCVNGKWGYITTSGEVAIEPIYNQCLNFTSSGAAYVLDGDTWVCIRLYEHNH